MKGEREKHDYDPGDDGHPMHTDPMCVTCGWPKNYYLHDTKQLPHMR